MQKVLTLILSMGFCWVLTAQEPADSINALPESTVVGNRILKTTASKQIVFASTTAEDDYRNGNPSADLSKLLSSTSGFIFRNFGVSGSSVAHYRGSTPEQFQVFWNGVNINSPFLGQFDFSLVPGSFFAEPQVNDISSGTLTGSGTVGGSLSLSDGGFGEGPFRKLNYYDKIQTHANASVEYSSLNNLFVTGTFGQSRKQRSFQTKIALSDFENNFKFRNTALAGNPETPMQNADGQILNFSQNYVQRISKNASLDFDYWGTIAERGIPLQDFQTSRDDRQEDSSHRFSLLLSGSPSFIYAIDNIEIGAAGVFDRISFNGDESLARKASFFAQSRSSSFIGANALNFTARLNADFIEAETNNFAVTETRNVFGVSSSLFYSPGAYTVGATLRQDLLDGELMPTVGSISIMLDERKDKKLKSWKLDLSRNYRFPSLNDWFWNPGGNPDLLPEHSLGVDASQKFQFLIPYKGNIELELSEYYNFTNDWIQWRPNAEGIWSPENIKEVSRLGLDWRLRHTGRLNGKGLKRLTIDFSGNVNRSREKNGDPILFHPKFKSNLALGFFLFPQLKVTAQYEMQHRRWDGAEFLDDLHVVDVGVLRTKLFGTNNVNVQVMVRNVFNQAFVYRPHQIMPGRHFSIKLSYNYRNIKKNEN